MCIINSIRTSAIFEAVPLVFVSTFTRIRTNDIGAFRVHVTRCKVIAFIDILTVSTIVGAGSICEAVVTCTPVTSGCVVTCGVLVTRLVATTDTLVHICNELHRLQCASNEDGKRAA